MEFCVFWHASTAIWLGLQRRWTLGRSAERIHDRLDLYFDVVRKAIRVSRLYLPQAHHSTHGYRPVNANDVARVCTRTRVSRDPVADYLVKRNRKCVLQFARSDTGHEDEMELTSRVRSQPPTIRLEQQLTARAIKNSSGGVTDAAGAACLGHIWKTFSRFWFSGARTR